MSLSDPFKDFPSDRRKGISHKPVEDYTPPVPPPFNREATLHWLEKVKHDDWWKTQMPIPRDSLGAVLGLYPGELAVMLNNDAKKRLDATLPRISRLIPDIEARKLVFPPTKRGKTTITKFLWLEPPPPPKIGKLSQAWSFWACCSSCGGNRFLPIAIDMRPHVACYNCLHPTQYPAIGATRIYRSLIHEVMPSFY